MALSGFRGKDEGTPTVPMKARSAAASGGSSNLTAFIDQGSEFEGKLSFKDTVRIDGRFTGEINSENTLIVGETGEIDARISSTTVVISGTVTGDVKAGRQVVLHKTARVDGNLHTPSIVIEEGAVFNGQVVMGGGDKPRSQASLKAIKGGSGESGDSS
ncbi:MAG: polymer-forming cytoskeletal protein [Proteobacteria bacterium]|nr:polymer-forming cytoskeletal protein [Pseudomonadota bacterium]